MQDTIFSGCVVLPSEDGSGLVLAAEAAVTCTPMTPVTPGSWCLSPLRLPLLGFLYNPAQWLHACLPFQ